MARARQLREAAGVSQRQMAAHVGVAPSVLASWEAGRIVVPGLAKPEAARRWLAALRFLDATSDDSGGGGYLRYGPITRRCAGCWPAGLPAATQAPGGVGAPSCRQRPALAGLVPLPSCTW